MISRVYVVTFLVVLVTAALAQAQQNVDVIYAFNNAPDEDVARPQFPSQIFAGDDLSWSFEEHGQNLKGLARNLEPHASLPKFVPSQVDLIEPKA